MLDKIKTLFANDPHTAAHDGFEPLTFAVAALLVEAARMDDTFDEAEHGLIARHLGERFGLDDDGATRLVRDAEAEVANAVEVYGYTRTVKNRTDDAERLEILQMLWEVAYADGELHDFEANLMRRMTGLLHVSDQDNGRARKAALARLQGG